MIPRRTAAALAALLILSAGCSYSDSRSASGATNLTGVASSNPDTTKPSTATTVSSNSAGAGLSGLAVVSDDFTQYSGTDDLLNHITKSSGGTGGSQSLYNDGAHANLIELDKTVLYNGHATMKYNQPGGVPDTPNLHVNFPATSHLWFRVKVRFSPGFTTTGTLNYANAYKLLSWGWTGEGSGRLEITNTIQYELYENVQAGPTLTGGGSYLIGGTISTEWTDGGWYDYIVEVDHSAPAGVIRLWRAKGGQTPIYIGQASETMNSGSVMPPIETVTLGLNFNQIRRQNQNQALWWGEWEVVDGTKHQNPFLVSR